MNIWNWPGWRQGAQRVMPLEAFRSVPIPGWAGIELAVGLRSGEANPIESPEVRLKSSNV